jgi:hypothetical protein
LIYPVGLIVVIMAILSLFGFPLTRRPKKAQ